jgi:hypothetical protein
MRAVRTFPGLVSPHKKSTEKNTEREHAGKQHSSRRVERHLPQYIADAQRAPITTIGTR